MAREIDGPAGKMPADELISRLVAMDLLVHTWDLARAVGVDDRLDEDIRHAVEHALVAADEDDTGKVLYLGPDRAGNLLEIVTVLRDDGTEIVIHAMKMRRIYEPLLGEIGEPDG